MSAITTPVFEAGLQGLGISNGTDTAHDIDIAAGECRDEENARDLVFAGVTTIAIDAAAGAGALDTGVVANDTFYHVYVIEKSSDATQSGIFSLSKTFGGVTKPTGYDIGRRVGCVRTDGSANIRQFRQTAASYANRWIMYDINFADSIVLTDGASETLVSVDVSGWVPETAVNVTCEGHLLRGDSSATDSARLFPTGAATETLWNISAARATTTDSEASGHVVIPVTRAGTIDYDLAGAGQKLNVYVTGFEDDLAPYTLPVIDALLAEYDASKGAGLNGTDLSGLADQAPGADGTYDLSQSTEASQPAYNTTDTDFNGHPSFTLDGSADFMENLAALGAVIAGDDQPFTWVVVCKVTNNGTVLALRDDESLPAHNIGRVAAPNRHQTVRHDGVTQKFSAVASTWDANAHVQIHTFDGTTGAWHEDGAEIYTGVDLDVNTIAAADDFYVGAQSPASGFMAGDFTRALIYSRALTAADDHGTHGPA